MISILQLKGFELLRAVHLEPLPFDIDRDLITPTFKLKRTQLLKHYKARKPNFSLQVMLTLTPNLSLQSITIFNSSMSL